MKGKVTIAQLQKKFVKRIPAKIKRELEKFIDNETAQAYIKKALKYELSDADVKELYKIGKIGAEMSRLHWLCCIYIHPLTQLAGLAGKVDRLYKSL